MTTQLKQSLNVVIKGNWIDPTFHHEENWNFSFHVIRMVLSHIRISKKLEMNIEDEFRIIIICNNDHIALRVHSEFNNVFGIGTAELI